MIIKKSTLLFTALYCAIFAGAQPTTNWSMGSDGSSTRLATTMDPAGNTYFAGTFSGNLLLEGQELNAIGSPDDNFIGKLDPNGALVWVKPFGSIANEQVTDIQWNQQTGHVYVAGGFKGAFTEAGITAVSSSAQDMFVGTLDKDGNWLDLVTPNTNLNTDDLVRKMVVSPTGQTYVMGELWDPFPNKCYLYLGNIAANEWSFQNSADDIFRGLDLAIDSEQNMIVAGGYQGLPATPATLPAADYNYYDAFIGKYNNVDGWQWMQPIGSAGSNDIANSVTTDEDGNIFVAGYFSSGSVTIGDTVLYSVGGLGTQDIYVAKISPAGEWLWVKSFGGFGDDAALDIKYNKASKSLLLSGYFTSQINFGPLFLSSQHSQRESFVARLDTYGNPLWVRSMSGNGFNYCQGADINDNGDIVAGGFMRYNLLTDEPSLALTGAEYPSGGATFYIVKMHDATLVGNHEIPEITGISVAPNPVSRFLTLQLSEIPATDIEYQVRNTLGQTVQLGKIPAGQQQITLDFQAIPVGDYWLTMQQGGAQTTVKIVAVN